MTESERRALRHLINERKRELVAGLTCGYCGQDIEQNPSRPTKRFCSAAHRRYAWYRDTEKGREQTRERKRRRYAARRAQQPVQP